MLKALTMKTRQLMYSVILVLRNLEKKKGLQELVLQKYSLTHCL